MAAVMIGVDPHKGSHTAMVVGADEGPLGQVRVRASAAQAERLLAWAAAWPERTWAVEGAGGLGHLLAQQLVSAGERVLDVQPKLAARVRLLAAGAVNKNDPAPIEVSSGNRVVRRLSLRGNRRLNHAIHMAAITQIRCKHSDGRACYDKKIAEGKTPKEALRALKRQISDALYRCLKADAARAAASIQGPGGHAGNDSVASAAGSHPERQLFGQATPGPATTLRRPADQQKRPAHGPEKRPHEPLDTKRHRSGRFGRGDVLRSRPLVTGDSVATSHHAQPLLPICRAGGSRDPGEVVSAAGLVTLVPAARDQRLRNRRTAALT